MVKINHWNSSLRVKDCILNFQYHNPKGRANHLSKQEYEFTKVKLPNSLEYQIAKKEVKLISFTRTMNVGYSKNRNIDGNTLHRSHLSILQPSLGLHSRTQLMASSYVTISFWLGQ